MIAIKGFEIPKKCIWDCPFCNGEGGACELADIKTSNINRPLDCPLKEVHEADYEARLKADIEAILVELQLEIEESCICTYEVNKLIQEKINELKAESEEKL